MITLRREHMRVTCYITEGERTFTMSEGDYNDHARVIKSHDHDGNWWDFLREATERALKAWYTPFELDELSRAGLIPIKERPGFAWWSGSDPLVGKWIEVEVEPFMERWRKQQENPEPSSMVRAMMIDMAYPVKR